jgi:hypothetical protein
MSKALAKLTDKQRAFIAFYLQTLNATKAAELAKYKGNGKTLAVIGHENLRKPNIQKLVSEGLQEIAMSPVEIMARLAAHARADISDYADIKDASDLSEVESYPIKRIKKTYNHKTDEESIEIEMYSSQVALWKIAKLQGMFPQDININVSGHIEHEHKMLVLPPKEEPVIIEGESKEVE